MYLTVIILLNIPFIQEKITVAVTKELKHLLHTELTIGKIDIGLLNRIIVDDLRLEDRSGKEMLKVTRLSAKFSISSLFQGKIIINGVQLFGFNINLNKQNPESAPNFQFLVDAFASKDTLKEKSPLDLRINSILIRRGKLAYDVWSEPETPGKFNVSHVQLRNLIGNISLKALSNDSLNAQIKRLSFDEKSGFQLKKLTVKALANARHLQLENFRVQLPATSLALEALRIDYDSLENAKQIRNKISFRGILKGSEITLKDFSAFIPALTAFRDPLEMEMRFDGNSNQLNCPFLEIKAGNHIALSGNLSMMDYSKGKDAYLFGKLKRLNISQEGSTMLYQNLTGNSQEAPAILTRLGDLSFHGEISGYLDDLVTYGDFSSSLGNVRCDLKLNTGKPEGKLNYSGRIITESFRLGKLLDKENKLGDISFNLDLKGLLMKGQWPEIDLKGTISSVEYNKYPYENIELDGIFRQGGFDGKININDANGAVFVNGSFNLAEEIPTFNFRAVVDKLRPNDLHLTDKYKDSDFSLIVKADFKGNSIDDMIGEIRVDSFSYNSPAKDYFLNHIQITASKSGNEKLVTLTSGFMNATVKGNYSYRKVPSSIVRTFERYIPSLITSRSTRTEGGNDFAFDIDIYDTRILSDVFGIPVDLKSRATVKGYFNDNAGKLRIEGYFPGFSYKERNFESGMLVCENSSGQFRCKLRATTFTNEASMLNLSLETTAQNDRLNTSVHWGNNKSVTYGGSFSALTSFFKTEGDKPLLKVNVDILPSEVILNDTVWNIHPSRIAVDSGKVYVENFLFEHKNQFLKINGKLTPNAKDTVKVGLNDINLAYVFDIINFDDVDFQGLASGNVYINQTLRNPNLNAMLHVKRFTFNDALMGEMNLFGTWDKEKEGIFIDAAMHEQTISATKVRGYVFPKKKGLDLRIDADSTNLKFLEFFMKDIASDVQGRTTGYVRLFGGFKSLNLEGRVIADASFKINVLNTSFALKRDSVRLIPDEIQFRDLAIYDPEGHRGRLDGSLFHQNLKNLSYRFRINTDNMLVFNAKESADLPFYGTIYGTGNVLINGSKTTGLNVEAAMSTNRRSNFAYITGMNNAAGSNQFITFVDKTPRRNLRDSLDMRTGSPVETEKQVPNDIRLNIQIDATPDATMKIIMDPVAGDYISGTGEGNIRLDYFNKGDVKIFGNYTINQGVYKFSLQEIIRKDFTINRGSTISFSGNPIDANLDIEATYTVNSASLSDLGLGETFSQNNVKVNCIMKLAGNLQRPSVTFDLDLPNVNEEERELVRSAVSTQEQMNMQILYLLGIGKFYTYDYGNSTGQSSNAMSSVLSSTLSGQLNNMLSQIIDSNKWNFGTNVSTGEKGWTDVEVEGILSGQLLNNRLLINGNFGYRDNPLASTNFVGDFDIEWLLTKSGEIRLKAYNQANDRYYAKTTLTTQGIGIIYKKDFNTWRDLLIWHLKKKQDPSTGQKSKSKKRKEPAVAGKKRSSEKRPQDAEKTAAGFE